MKIYCNISPSGNNISKNFFHLTFYKFSWPLFECQSKLTGVYVRRELSLLRLRSPNDQHINVKEQNTGSSTYTEILCHICICDPFHVISISIRLQTVIFHRSQMKYGKTAVYNQKKRKTTCCIITSI